MAKALSKRETDIFENLSVPRAVAALAVPTVISQLVSVIYNIADTWYLGQLNDTHMLAAVTVVFPLTTLIFISLSNLFGIGGGSLLSRCLGKKDYDGARMAAATATWGGVAASLLYILIVVLFEQQILEFLGADANSFKFAHDYLFWTVFLGTLPSIMSLTISHIIRGEGASREASIGMTGGAILNIIIDPFFIFDKYLGMGVEGAAIATFLSNCASILYFTVLIYRRRTKLVASYLPQDICFSGKFIWEIVSIGLPSAMIQGMSFFSNCTLNYLMSGYNSAAALASVGIIKKVDMIPTHMVMGICGGIIPLLAYNYARGDKKRVFQSFYFAAFCSLCITIPFLTMCQFFSKSIIRLFIDNAETIKIGSGFLRLHCLSSPFLSTSFLVMAYFQATGKAKPAIFISFLRKGALDIPFMFLMNVLWPIYGIIAVQPIMDVLVSIIAIVTYFICTRRKYESTTQKIKE